MTTISASFTATGVSAALYVVDTQTATYATSGTFVASLVLERTRNGGQTWDTIATYTTTGQSGTIRDPGTYRWRCDAFTSGTAVATITAQAYPLRLPIVNQSGQTMFGVTDQGITGRILPRVVALTDAATITPNADTTDVGELLTVSQGITFANPTGTPSNKQILQIDVTAAGVQTIAYGTQYQATANALPAVTAAVTASFLWQWTAATSKWRLLEYNAGV